MLLGPRHLPLRCAKCDGRSYLGLGGNNTRWALVILGISFIGWFWLSTSQGTSGLPRELLPVALAGIWAVGVLTAFSVFTFGGRLTPLISEKAPKHRLTARRAIGDWVFLGSMVIWMYFVFRALLTAS